MRRRLVTLALASTSLVAVAFLVPLFGLVAQLATDRAVRPAELAARSLAPTAALVDPDTLTDVLAATATDLHGTASVVQPDGTVLGAPIEVDAAIERIRRELVADRIDHDGGQRVLVPVVTDSGVAVVDVRVPVDRTGILVAWTALGVLGVLLVAGATLLADRMARDTVRGARALEATATRLSAGELGASAAVTSPPDLARVSAALDQLATRIADLLAEAREDAADLSHGLRTPLTALRLDVDALPPSPERERLLADLGALDAAISQVIDDARAPLRTGAGEGADLVAVVDERTAFWSGLADDEGRSIAVALPDHPVRTPVPASDARTTVDVLLDNAFRHTPAGTPVQVHVLEHEDTVVLVIADAGPGFPDGVDVLDRGRSGGGGSGLGLDIVRRTVQRAGGQVELGRSGPLGGAVVRCVLPRSGAA